MSYSPLPNLALANYLKIVSKGAVYNNLSEDSEIWKFIKKMRKKDEGRLLQFMLKSGYGAASVGFVSASGDYPAAAKSKLVEGKANYKDFALTVEIERSIIARALSDLSKYGDPIAEEIRSKTDALARQLSMAVYQDGTGVIGEVESHGTLTAAPAGTTFTVTIKSTNAARGHIGWFELLDRVAFHDTDGNPSLSSHNNFEVVDRNRALNQLTLKTTSGPLTIAANALNNKYIYRVQQPTKPDLGSISDYGSASEAFVGLASLSANDGRVVNNITLSGSLGGTRLDANGQPIDNQHFQQVMSNVMVNVGQSRYKYSAAMMAWETLNALIDAHSTNRQFININDNKGGVRELGYQHGKNTIIFKPDEFCPKSKVYIIPDADVLQFHGSDFELVKASNDKGIQLKPSSSGTYARSVQLFMEGTGALISTHSAAIGVIENFTN